jgi:glycosyltransferase involved in cell wall biosynthesis
MQTSRVEVQQDPPSGVVAQPITTDAIAAGAAKPLTIAMLGLRSIEATQGGVETHVRHLTRELARHGNRVVILGRSPYVPKIPAAGGNGLVRTVSLWAPRNVSLEALLHSFVGVLYAAFNRPDILHIHAVGPGLVAPFARLFGLRVVFTHHGEDYAREKWGRLGKTTLLMGETFASRSANEVICISDHLKALLVRKFGRTSHKIPNGVQIPSGESPETLTKFGLSPHKYILSVGRIVPEKRQADLIHAYRLLRDKFPDWRLALVGKADHESDYARSLTALANETEGVAMCGFQQGAALAQLYSAAGVFALPSSHEGHPIALLEAMAFGLPVIAADIPANLEVGLPADCYTPMGDVGALASRFGALMARIDAGEPRPDWSKALLPYDWAEIAAATTAVYARARR